MNSSETGPGEGAPPAAAPAASAPTTPTVSFVRIFRVFFVIGITSFGGGIVAYLRDALVERERWLTDDEFLAALEIGQTLPGLNATNVSVIVGKKLRGIPGSIAAVLGMLIPGTTIVMLLGYAYTRLHGSAEVAALLAGVAAAAVGLLFAVTVQIGKKQLTRMVDFAIVLLVFYLVGVKHVSLLVALVFVGPLAVWLHRPKAAPSATATSPKPNCHLGPHADLAGPHVS
jgi:chromate transporter